METNTENSNKFINSTVIHLLRSSSYSKKINEISPMTIYFLILVELPYSITFGVLFLVNCLDKEICGRLHSWGLYLSYALLASTLISFIVLILTGLYHLFKRNRTILKIYVAFNMILKIFYSVTSLTFTILLSIFFFSSENITQCEDIFKLSFAWLMIQYVLFGLVLLFIFFAIICHAYTAYDNKEMINNE
jgi:hypothetical protein